MLPARTQNWLWVLASAAVAAVQCGGEIARNTEDAAIAKDAPATTDAALHQTASCGQDCTSNGMQCCAGTCVDLANDPQNCGRCGVSCTAPSSYCQDSRCLVPPCDQDAACGASSCCGTECCGQGQICCTLRDERPTPTCYTLQNNETTCPSGCPLCR
jgi:hypothetical protein